jgi:hypothetical protein
MNPRLSVAWRYKPLRQITLRNWRRQIIHFIGCADRTPAGRT